ncbi:hypothetical protein GM418_13885 [Maribellus comscasis]|uniref:Uncharacterized protein n=1 Tax=Maribellus comscasis TaxID=2681766 RepID=A0A6I6JX39_9BACT|nr:hypothetical protein [Maribellus comscasis]QGY44717.1 hypothetical protein GM418_13885 [Maribellus comscasis]
METNITTEKIVKKQKTLKGLSVILFLIGIYLLLTEDFSVQEDSVNILSIIQTVLFFIMGVTMFITSSITIKKMNGIHIRFYPNEHSNAILIDYKIQKAEAKSISIDNLDSIIIKINSIEFIDSQNRNHNIDLVDFSSFEDRKTIKDAFNKIKEKNYA